jgi:hypothetical protein
MERSDHSLYITITSDGLKMGTCEHCVTEEECRPERAWNPNGDSELDFDRDGFLTRLKELGVRVEITQEYVCP